MCLIIRGRALRVKLVEQEIIQSSDDPGGDGWEGEINRSEDRIKDMGTVASFIGDSR